MDSVRPCRPRLTPSYDSPHSNTLDLDDLCALHAARLQNDPNATDLLARALVPLVSSRLRHRWPRGDPQMLLEVVHDSVLWYLANPRRYTPNIALLDVFLAHVAHRRMQDGLRKLARVKRTEVSLEDVTNAAWVGMQATTATENWGPFDALARHRLFAVARSPRERAFLKASLRGESLQQIGRVLGCFDESSGGLLTAVQQVLKRLHQRVVRSSHHDRVKTRARHE